MSLKWAGSTNNMAARRAEGGLFTIQHTQGTFVLQGTDRGGVRMPELGLLGKQFGSLQAAQERANELEPHDPVE